MIAMLKGFVLVWLAVGVIGWGVAHHPHEFGALILATFISVAGMLYGLLLFGKN